MIKLPDVISLKHPDELPDAFSFLPQFISRSGYPKNHRKDLVEWWAVRDCIELLIAIRRWPFPSTLEKLRGEAQPDFLLQAFEGNNYIEITEATDCSDQREMAIQPDDGKAYPIGYFAGRLSEGTAGDEAEILLCGDIIEAINNKISKKYVLDGLLPTELFIYCNSNPQSISNHNLLVPHIKTRRDEFIEASKKFSRIVIQVKRGKSAFIVEKETISIISGGEITIV